jgi:hypothetical protein
MIMPIAAPEATVVSVKSLRTAEPPGVIALSVTLQALA